MNITKKRVLSLLMVLALMVGLVACGGGKTNAAGTYNLTKMDMNGVSVDLDQLTEEAGVEVKITLILKEDGNFSLDMGTLGVSESLSGTWKADGNNLTLTSEGTDVPATLDGTTITMSQDGQTMTFEKE